jgi:hypothetical protein
MAWNEGLVVDVISCALVLLLISNLSDVNGFPGFFATVSSLFCCVALYQWKAHLRMRNISFLLALCGFSAVLGVLSSHFREFVYQLGFVFLPFRGISVDFPDVVISPIDGRHIAPTGDTSVEMDLALYTQYARRIIETSQNRCGGGAPVFEVGAYPHGMGSELTYHATVLAHAIDNKAVFAWGAQSCTLYGAQCREFYEKEHNCSAAQILSMSTVVFAFDAWPETKVPRVFLDALPKTFTVQQALYWWRAQAFGYLMRFNVQTRERIRALRSERFDFSLGGAININIRGGDKLHESRLIAPELYVDRALELIEQSPLAYSRVLFLTSDDPRSLARASSYAETKHLKAIYLDIPRMKYGNDASKTASFWTFNLTISMLLQLSMTAECAAWVGSRTSNWNRVIDSFRCTAVANCRGVFAEMEDTIKGYYYGRPYGNI